MASTGDSEEEDHWHNVMRTFLFYEDFVAFDLGRRQEHINKLPPKFADRLPNLTFEKFPALQHASVNNQVFFEDMVHFQASNNFHAQRGTPSKYPTKNNGPIIPLNQQHRNIAVLHSLYREWSVQGLAERDSTFKLLVDELKLRLPVTAENAFKQKVLVPGCGLGRLPLEIAACGYACQGNEYSAFMAIASNYVLNGITQANDYTVYPWVSSVCNIATVQDSLHGVAIPDVAAGDLLDQFCLPSISASSTHDRPDPTATATVQTAQTVLDCSYYRAQEIEAVQQQQQQQMQQQQRKGAGGVGGDGGGQKGRSKAKKIIRSRLIGSPPDFPRFSMAAGDFVDVYTNLANPRFQQDRGRTCTGPGGVVLSDSSLAEDYNAGQWDAVVTCFFIDTAPVVLEYIEAIERMLKPGGVWINLGPLLYHWSTSSDAHIEDNSDARYGQSVELSYEEVKEVVLGYGFEFLQETWQDCTYTRCASSMMWTTYKTVQFTVRKPVVLCSECSIK